MRRALLFMLSLLAVVAHAAEPKVEKFSFGRFGATTVYRPSAVRHVALFFSDDKGWSAGNDSMARALADHGFLVAGIDQRHYAAELAKPRDKCSYLAGEFEDFSHELQKHLSPERYHLPLLVGVGRASGLIYGVTAQGSSGTFVGALTVGFTSHWMPMVRLCQSYGLRYDDTKKNESGGIVFKPTSQLSTPWVSLGILNGNDRESAPKLQAMREFVKQTGTAKSFVADDSALQAQFLASAVDLSRADQDLKVFSDELRDLPLEEVRATGVSTRQLALFLTGDGGWAEIDKGVSAELSRRGIDVVAMSSLQYFWKPRSPDGTAKDVERILRHYLAAWRKSEILIVGYSFGADVAPFVVNRLPSDLRNAIVGVSLLGIADSADFEVHVTTWLGVDHHGLPTRPEVERLAARVLCVYGEGEKDSLCPSLARPNIKIAKVGDGHHFSDQYRALAEEISSLSNSRH